ncbi:hypothetical protein BS78_K047800 [Paspalum vaginatum]|uniref:Uncharacterized protein n=1 Tax=Paspalum vaginatum TaxID=158149 RepID=A0A9W8CFZ1_9POAL|nr:hypothetical protein BS78_K047800 [Paspalum vaginatum]
MFLRRLTTSAALRGGATDGGLVAALRAEIAHELSSSAPAAPAPFPSEDAPGFAVVSDAPRAQDVLLRRRDERSEEEVLVSALLAPLRFVGQEPMPRAALMKVFVSRPAAAAMVLHFDCRTVWVGEAEERGAAADYAIDAVRYHSSPGGAGEGKYEGPQFRIDSVVWEVLWTRSLGEPTGGVASRNRLNQVASRLALAHEEK